jgi:hypothetical protein
MTRKRDEAVGLGEQPIQVLTPAYRNWLSRHEHCVGGDRITGVASTCARRPFMAPIVSGRPVYHLDVEGADLVIVTSEAGANRVYEADGRRFAALELGVDAVPDESTIAFPAPPGAASADRGDVCGGPGAAGGAAAAAQGR